MREMHKWKDKVELNLDNRQIFFLFFGLSVVGCFVFALGVMVGRRVEVGPGGEVASLAGDSLSILDGHGEVQTELSFQEGLKATPLDDVPPTRSLEDEAAAEAEQVEAVAAAAAPAPPAPKPAVLAAAPAHKPAPVKPAAAPAKPKPAPAKAKPAADETTLASSSKTGKSPKSAAKSDGRQFTLQMKAFAKKEDAEAFAAKLDAKGHTTRVESQEVKGRLWHRVRVGSFDSWTEGIAAKEAFEQKEKIIAYVVRK